MAFDFADLVDHDTIIAAENIDLQEEVKEKQIVTPLFTVTFHNMEIGNVVVDGANGLFLGDLFNLCDRIVIRIATAIVNAQELIFGLEAVATKQTKSLTTCFDKDLNLLPEYSEKMDDAKSKRASTYVAEIQAYMKTLDALIDARAKLIPMAKRPLQFAWNSETQKPIDNFKEALAYRIASGNTMKDIQKRWADQKNNKGKMVKNLDFVSLADILG